MSHAKVLSASHCELVRDLASLPGFYPNFRLTIGSISTSGISSITLWRCSDRSRALLLIVTLSCSDMVVEAKRKESARVYSDIWRLSAGSLTCTPALQGSLTVGLLARTE